MTGPVAHRARVIEARGAAVTAVRRDVAFVPRARNVPMAGPFADRSLVVVARLTELIRLNMARVAGDGAGVLRTRLEADAGAHPDGAGVSSTHRLAVARVLVDAAVVEGTGVVTDARVGLQAPGVPRTGVLAHTAAQWGGRHDGRGQHHGRQEQD